MNAFGDSGHPLMLPMSCSAFDKFIADNFARPDSGCQRRPHVVSTGPANVPVLVGAAQFSANGPVDGFAIFHRISDAQEAVVPLEMRNAGSYLLAFDNTDGIVLRRCPRKYFLLRAGNITVLIRDDTGAQIGTGSISLPGSAHTSFVLSSQFAFTANIRGTAEFFTPAGGRISLLGIRFTPPGTLTTIPVLANVGTSGGSIAHLASANGWTTTVVLVNTGSSAAQARLSFFADDGTPLPLSVSFPQVGGAASPMTVVDRTLAAGATLMVQSTGAVADPVLIGSAQLTTNGNVSGFVIFHYQNGQEAVVPLESRNAGAYIIAFDNTASTGNGIAVNSVSAQAANIPVILRDESGAQIGTGAISLAANGHSAFVLSSQFPVTANIRGTIEFDAPAGVTIGALGIRTPIAHTFTTLPALAK